MSEYWGLPGFCGLYGLEGLAGALRVGGPFPSTERRRNVSAWQSDVPETLGRGLPRPTSCVSARIDIVSVSPASHAPSTRRKPTPGADQALMRLGSTNLPRSLAPRQPPV